VTIWLWVLVALTIIGGLIFLLWALATYLPRGRFWRGIGLQDGLPPGTGVHRGDGSPPTTGGTGGVTGPLKGFAGVAITDLHPAGTAWIGERRVDVVTEGGFIASGTEVEVILDEGYRRVVQRRDQPSSERILGTV